MKIAFITHTAYPDFIGGREHHINNLASSFSKKDKIVVIAGTKAKKIQKRDLDGYKLITLPMLSVKVSSNPLQIYRIIPRIFSVLKEEKPDLVHAFEYGSYSTDSAYFYVKRYNIPFFLTIYGYQFKNPILKLAKKVYDYFIGRKLLYKAEKIFYPSEVQYKEILDIAKVNLKNKTVLQENCIRVRDYYNKTGIKGSLAGKHDLDDEIKLLTVVRILPRKGVIYLVLALDKLIRQYGLQAVKLVIIGPDCGELKNINKKIQKLDLKNNIIIIGAISPTRIKHFLQDCDIFVLPSLYEGLPLALMEAMAAGKPVVFSKIPCAKKIIVDGRNGRLVEPADVNSLVRVLYSLISNKAERDRLGQEAKRNIMAFDSSYEAKKMRNIYKEALRKRGSVKYYSQI